MFNTFDYEYVYWWGSFWQMLVMAAFLINIWRTKDCSGISLRTQVLYALVFITRQQDLDRYFVPVEHIVIKVVYLIIALCTVLSIFKFYSKTYEKEKDTFRIEIPVISCIALSLIFNKRFEFWHILTVFSLYIEAIAMVPQFHFIFKTKCTNKYVFLYIVCMAMYALGQVVYMSSQYWYGKSYRIVANTIQFMLYCDFFGRIYHLICPQADENQQSTSRCCFFQNLYKFLCSQQSQDVEANVENETPNTGHLASNFSSIVLTPSTLEGSQIDKGFSLETEGAIKK